MSIAPSHSAPTAAPPRSALPARLAQWGPLAVMALAFALRVFHLGSQSLWYDEAFSLWLAHDSLRELLSRVASVDNHPPMFAVLLWGALRLFGESEFAIRTVSAGASTLAVAGMLRLGTRAGGPPLGLAAGLLAALSPFYLYYAQEARGYALTLLWGVLALDAALDCLATNRLRAWVRLGAAVLLSLWTHYAIGFALLCMAAVLGARSLLIALRQGARAGLLGPVAAAAIVVVAYAAWVPYALAAIARDRSYYEGALPVLPVFNGLLMGFAGWLERTGAPLTDVAPFGAALALLAVAGGVAGLRRPGALAGGRWSAVLLLLIAWAPLLAYTFLQTQVAKYHPRYLMTATPAYYLLAAGAVVALLRAGIAGRVVAAGAVLVLGAGWAGVLQADLLGGRPPKDDWRAVGAHLTAHRAPDEPVLALAGYARLALLPYLPPDGVVPVPDTVIPLIDRQVDGAELARVDAAVAGAKRLWLVEWQQEVMDPSQQLERALNAAGKLETDVQFTGVRVRSFALTGAPLAAQSAGQPVNANFADQVALDGLDTPPAVFAAGEALPLRLHWRAERAPDRNFKVAVSLLDAQRVEWGRTDLRPAGELNYTRRWTAGATFSGDVWVPAAPGTPPGSYTLELQLYDEDTLAPVPAAIVGRGVSPLVTLGSVQVVARPFTPALFEGMTPATGEAGGLRLAAYRLSGTPTPAGDDLELRLGWEVVGPPTGADLTLTLDGQPPLVLPALAPDALPLAQPGDRFITVVRVPTPPQATGAANLTVQVGAQRAFAASVRIEGRPLVLQPPAVTTIHNAQFGAGLDLYGSSLQPAQAAPGSTVNLRLVWHAQQRVTERYKVFVHVLDERGNVVAQHDGEPAANTLRTSRWAAGEYVEDVHPLALPATLPPGPYRLRVGMYTWPDGARLPLATGADAFDLPQPLTVAAR